jgi:hypothetical protein
MFVSSRIKTLLFGLLACAAALILTPSSDAGFKLFIDGETATKTISDGGVDDGSAGANGRIVFDGTVGKLSVIVTVGLSKPSPLVTNTPFQAQMDVQISLSSTDGGTFSIQLTDTGFSINGTTYILQNSLLVNGITGASLTANTVVDMTGSGLNEFTPASSVNGTTIVSAGALGPVNSAPASLQNSSSFAGTSPFSMNMIINTTVQPGGSITSLDYKSTIITPAPAGVFVVLSAVPVLGVAGLLRRRLSRKQA